MSRPELQFQINSLNMKVAECEAELATARKEAGKDYKIYERDLMKKAKDLAYHVDCIRAFEERAIEAESKLALAVEV